MVSRGTGTIYGGTTRKQAVANSGVTRSSAAASHDSGSAPVQPQVSGQLDHGSVCAL